ncbi:efflux RND transporter periplasmic adaptor subunit [Enterococcus gilvus]|uniref:efflux RND transporter periplasmic adaptor subunit n=1 Tax=Enterococcus gilvus TaxID=160453 RepID=UPI003ED98AF0
MKKSEHRKIKKIYFYFGGLALIILIILILNISSSQEQATKDDQKNEPKIVSIKNLVSQQQEDTSYLTGKIVPNETSKINADSTKGMISEVYVKVGDVVKKGDKLFSYSSTDIQVALLEAKSDTEKAQNKINSLNQTISSKTTQLNNEQKDLENLNQKISTAKDEEKESLNQQKKQLEDAIATLQSDINTANSDLNDANSDLEKSTENQEIQQQKNDQETVTSTVDGIVQKIDETQINTAIGSGDNKTFMELMDTSSLKVQGDVNEFKKDDLSINQQAKIIDRQDQKKTWTGKIVKIDPIAKEEKDDNSISKYPFEVLMDGNNDISSIGKHVYILPQIQNNNVITIPTSFIFNEKNKNYVWKVKETKAFKQEITFETKKDGKAEVKSGLAITDELIVPTSKITNGMQVKK